MALLGALSVNQEEDCAGMASPVADTSVALKAKSAGAGRPSRGTSSRYLMRALLVLSLLLVVALIVNGYSYYSTPLADRPHHPDYRTLRPAATWGLMFGLIGTVMMLLMHIYSVRKHFKWARSLGTTQFWLNWHIFLGIMGPLFIMLHTSFKFNGIVAVSFWSMVAVALSGFVGRYLFQQMPRNIRGEQKSLEDLNRDLEAFPISTGEHFGLTKGAIARIEELSEPERTPGASPLRVLFRQIVDDLLLPLTVRRYRRELGLTLNLPRPAVHDLARIVRQQALLKRRIIYWEELRKLFHYWHVIHKPFAIVMYVIMAFHISVAMWTGYGWVS